MIPILSTSTRPPLACSSASFLLNLPPPPAPPYIPADAAGVIPRFAVEVALASAAFARASRCSAALREDEEGGEEVSARRCPAPGGLDARPRQLPIFSFLVDVVQISVAWASALSFPLGRDEERGKSKGAHHFCFPQW